MNERIKELANIWANRRAEDEKLGIVYTFSEPALEQFAQLIVRECAEVIFETPVKYTEIDIMHIIRDRVKEHFGVEE